MRVIILTMPSEKDHLLIALTVLIRQWTKAAPPGDFVPNHTHCETKEGNPWHSNPFYFWHQALYSYQFR